MMPPSYHSPAAEMCQQDPDPLHQATRGLVVSQKHTQPPPGITPPSTWVHSLHTGSQPPHEATASTRGYSFHLVSQPPHRVTASMWGHSPPKPGCHRPHSKSLPRSPPWLLAAPLPALNDSGRKIKTGVRTLISWDAWSALMNNSFQSRCCLHFSSEFSGQTSIRQMKELLKMGCLLVCPSWAEPFLGEGLLPGHRA